jgi:glutamine cyclotransferase
VVGAALYWGLGGGGAGQYAPEPVTAPAVPTSRAEASLTVEEATEPVSEVPASQATPTEAAEVQAVASQPESPLDAAARAAESPLVLGPPVVSPLATVPAQAFPDPTPTSVLTDTSVLTASSELTSTSELTDSSDLVPGDAITPVSLPEQLGLTAPLIEYEVVGSYPHDPGAFTQGLVLVDGVLYEGTGLRGASSLRRVDLESGEVLQQVDLEPEFFGEGVAVFGERILQLTWTERVAFVYDRESLRRVGQFEYTTEGWGLTHDGERLIMSDGTFVLSFRNPETFALLGSVEVYDEATPIVRLNELEFVEGAVFANVWRTDLIARIDPETGAVTGWMDMTGLLPEADRVGRQVDVLNGIAYDEATGHLLVTGKLWPRLFEVRLVE